MTKRRHAFFSAFVLEKMSRGWNVTNDINPPISGPPYEAPHFKPPAISSPLPPYQAPHMKPPISYSLQYQAPRIRPPTTSIP